MNGTAKITDEMTMQRLRMVEKLRDHYKIADERVLDAMAKLPRHLFVSEALKSQAYKDNALPISSGQTISQPFIVARMTELLELSGQEKVLEIGAGSGYQTAILTSLARKIFAIERLPNLVDEAERRLQMLGFRNFFAKGIRRHCRLGHIYAVRRDTCSGRRAGCAGTARAAIKDRRQAGNAAWRGAEKAKPCPSDANRD